jgi:two-component system chemotaxis response regulator CheY
MPHRKKILLSDSNEALSMLLADSLRERGNFHVFHAKDEDETTKALHRHRPHVLLLDFLLPHKGGFHVMQHLREDGYKISTIFMTALPTHRVIEEAYRWAQALCSRSLLRQGRWSNGYTMHCTVIGPNLHTSKIVTAISK